MLDFLDGSKTFLGGLILIGGAAAGMAFGIVDPMTGITLVGQGLAVWGIGHKIEKLMKSEKPIDVKGVNDETPT